MSAAPESHPGEKPLRHPDLPPLDLRNIELLPWQARAVVQALSGQHKGVAWAGGYGSGKSFLCCYIAVMLCHLRPGARVILAMDTFTRLNDIHLPMLAQMAPGAGGGAAYSPQTKTWTFANGSVLRLRHLDTPGDPNMGGSPIEGSSVHAVIIDESSEVHQGYWRLARARARVAVGIWPSLRIFSGLPIGTWWCTRAAAEGWPVHRPRTAANRANLDVGYEDDLRAGMTQDEQDALLDGRELVLQGGCYREYRAASVTAGGHWTPDRPTDWSSTQVLLVGDPGINFPHYAIAARDLRDPDAPWVIFHEWAPDNASVPDLCRDFRRVCIPRAEWDSRSPLIPVDRFVIDPAARHRGADGKAVADHFALPAPDGFGMRPVWNTAPERIGVVDGIDRVNRALFRRRLLFWLPMMEAGVAAHPDRRTLARCMAGYRWDPKRPGEPLKDNRNDHGADLVRYLVRDTMWDVTEGPSPHRPTAPARLPAALAHVKRGR